MVFHFIRQVIGDTDPVKRPEAIALNMWGRDKIGSESACAFVRHAYSAFYRDFTLVDTDNRKFIAAETFRHAVYSYRNAVLRYGESIRRFKIKRRFTHEKKKKDVPKEALLRFKELICFDGDSYRHSLAPDDNEDLDVAAMLVRLECDAENAAYEVLCALQDLDFLRYELQKEQNDYHTRGMQTHIDMLEARLRKQGEDHDQRCAFYDEEIKLGHESEARLERHNKELSDDVRRKAGLLADFADERLQRSEEADAACESRLRQQAAEIAVAQEASRLEMQETINSQQAQIQNLQTQLLKYMMQPRRT